MLSNHDVVRHATRYGLDLGGLHQALGEFPRNSAGGENLKVASQQWLLLEDGMPLLDRELGERRARAAVMLLLALPGSAYLYQGEELGLQEVVEIADHQRQDPSFFRNPGVDQGRDGCRVPLPWDADQPHNGFGGPPHLPQPEWFARYAAAQEAQQPESFLSLYRQALSLRRQLQGDEVLEWGGLDADEVLHLVRPGGWESVTNFGSESVDLPQGEVLLTSAPLEDGRLSGRSTAWIRRG